MCQDGSGAYLPPWYAPPPAGTWEYGEGGWYGADCRLYWKFARAVIKYGKKSLLWEPDGECSAFKLCPECNAGLRDWYGD